MTALCPDDIFQASKAAAGDTSLAEVLKLISKPIDGNAPFVISFGLFHLGVPRK
jgi:hypothetical protein